MINLLFIKDILILSTIIFVNIFSSQIHASGTEKPQPRRNIFQFNHDHNKWSQILNQLIIDQKSEKINMPSLVSQKENLEKYIYDLQSVVDTEYQGYSKNKKLAFVINAYNAFTLQALLNSDKPESFIKLNDESKLFIFFKHITATELLAKYIKRITSDPRVFLSLYCFSADCPKASIEAFTADKIDDQTEVVTKIFFSDKRKNYYDAKSKVMILSPVIKKLENEIIRTHGDISSFASKYLFQDQKLKRRARMKLIKVRYSSNRSRI